MSFIKMLQQVFELGSCEAKKKNIEIIQEAFAPGARDDSINKFSNYVLVEIILLFLKKNASTSFRARFLRRYLRWPIN